MSESLTHDRVLGQWLLELKNFELFKAQKELEDRIITSCITRLQALDLQDANLAQEYVKVRSRLDGIRQLQNMREHLIENRNRRDPA